MQMSGMTQLHLQQVARLTYQCRANQCVLVSVQDAVELPSQFMENW